MGICLGNGSDILLPPKKSDQLGFMIPNMVEIQTKKSCNYQSVINAGLTWAPDRPPWINSMINKLISSQSPQLIRTKSKIDQNYKYLPSISWSNHHFCRLNCHFCWWNHYFCWWNLHFRPWHHHLYGLNHHYPGWNHHFYGKSQHFLGGIPCHLLFSHVKSARSSCASNAADEVTETTRWSDRSEPFLGQWQGPLDGDGARALKIWERIWRVYIYILLL
jgi:hypothetical protein